MAHRIRKSLSQQAYQILLGRLLKNELVPGDIVNRRDIAHQLGMSVAPVLEALLQLVSEGYLESMPRRGTRVKPVRIEDVRGQLIVRESLECGAARFFCGKPIKDNYKRFLGIAEKLDAFNDESYERWQAEIAFHQDLVRLTEIDALIREFDRVFRLTIFYRLNRAIGVQRGKVSDPHVKLLKELTIDNSSDAENAIRSHIRAGKEHLFAST